MARPVSRSALDALSTAARPKPSPRKVSVSFLGRSARLTPVVRRRPDRAVPHAASYPRQGFLKHGGRSAWRNAACSPVYPQSAQLAPSPTAQGDKRPPSHGHALRSLPIPASQDCDSLRVAVCREDARRAAHDDRREARETAGDPVLGQEAVPPVEPAGDVEPVDRVR